MFNTYAQYFMLAFQGIENMQILHTLNSVPYTSSYHKNALFSIPKRRLHGGMQTLKSMIKSEIFM